MNEFATPDGFEEIEDGVYRRAPGTLRRPRTAFRVPRDGKMMVEVDAPPIATVDIQVLAEYQLLSDMETQDWADETLGKAVEDEKILGYTINYEATGAWGLRMISFLADIKVNAGTQDMIVRQANMILNEAVRDSDISVRWVIPI